MEILKRSIQVFVILSVFLAFYLLSNNFQTQSSIGLPLILGEELIPFLGWTGILYLSLNIEVPLIWLLIPSPYFKKTMLVFTAMFMWSVFFFVVFPTHYPRPLGETGWWVFDFFRRIDTPENCFPSLHVSTAIFLAMTAWKTINWKAGIFFSSWSLAVVISTLTAKQHYLLDVFGGIFMALLFFVFLTKKE